MSGAGMGGDEYDTILQAIEDHPRKMPDVLVCSSDFVEELEDQFGKNPTTGAPLYLGNRYVGSVMGMPLWIDDRFDQPVLISGYDH